jgi:hypothetical protein
LIDHRPRKRTMAALRPNWIYPLLEALTPKVWTVIVVFPARALPQGQRADPIMLLENERASSF